MGQDPKFSDFLPLGGTNAIIYFWKPHSLSFHFWYDSSDKFMAFIGKSRDQVTS